MNRWWLVLAVLLISASGVARGQGGYAGDWNLVVDNTTGRIPGRGPSAQLTIEVSGDQVTIRRFDSEPEIYQRGTAMPLAGGRTGTVTLSGIAMTVTATQWMSSDLETVTDEYMLVGNDLIVTRTLRVDRGGVPADPPQNRWEARYIRQ
jgi:hypothetical protein